MTPTLAPPLPLAALRAWLATAEELLDRQMGPDDPRYAAGLAAWNARHAEYLARALAEGEPE